MKKSAHVSTTTSRVSNRAAECSFVGLREAANDLERIADYLLLHAPDRAQELIGRVYEAPNSLLTFPSRGRPGKKEGTRELVLTPLPYIVVYTIRGDVVFVVRILHGAQQWP